MNNIDLKRPAPNTDDPVLIARLTRHLDARLHDLAEDWPHVLSADQQEGVIRVRFPGRSASDVARQLESGGISVGLEDDLVVFNLSARVSFEELDHVWGALFELM